MGHAALYPTLYLLSPWCWEGGSAWREGCKFSWWQLDLLLGPHSLELKVGNDLIHRTLACSGLALESLPDLDTPPTLPPRLPIKKRIISTSNNVRIK